MSKKEKKTKNPSPLSMSLAFSRCTVAAAAIFLIEAMVLTLALVFYYLDVPAGFKEWMQPDYWAFYAAGVFFLDSLVVWILILRVNHIRRRSDLVASSILGSDVQEAYSYGELGLVVVDENNIVLWENIFLEQRQFSLLDSNILAWRPKLADIASGKNAMTINVNDRFYQVKYIPQARVYLFKDTTDYEEASEYSRQQAVCIGLINIDNYLDIVGNAASDDNDVIAKVRGLITDYGKSMGALVRRYRNDSYLVICNFASLHKMEEDGFKLLSDVRALGKELHISPTLSIGFAHQIDDVNKLYEMASNAMDIATSRGGDQCVVSHYGEQLKFYGGRTAAIENTGRVQYRSLADSLLGIIQGSESVFVCGHMDADMDALGSCLGVMALCERVGVPCRIIFDPKLAEKKARMAFQSSFDHATLEKMTISPKEAEAQIKPSTLFVVVDVSNPHFVMAESALEKSAKTIVIDHHRRGESFVEKPVLSYVDPSAGSACEIFAEMFKYSSANPRIEVPPAYATLMLSGIFLDTGFFREKTTGVRSFEAAEILKQYGADNEKANDFLKDEIEEYNLTIHIASSMKSPYTGVAYCLADEEDIIERSTLAKVANQIRNLKGINASFVIGRIRQSECGISARSDGSINVQLLMEKLGGGGHFTAAAATFPNLNIQEVEKKLLEALDMYLDEAKTTVGGKEA